MNSAIAMGALVLGSWVLPGEEPRPQPYGTPLPPAAAAPAERPMPPTGAGSPYQHGSPTAPGGGASLPSAAQARQQHVPLAPTDPALSAPESPWQAPTAEGSATTLGFGSGAAAGRVSPYALPSRATTGYRSFIDYAGSGVGTQRGPSAPLRANKPFTGYRPPPAVSPYLNLFRNDTDGGLVDNYTTLVRPFVDQQMTNQMIGGQIQGLQGATRTQGRALQRMGQQIGTGAPEYFMNHGAFYGGFGR
jgi:hypothetical protein